MKYLSLVAFLMLASCHKNQNIAKDELIGASFDFINLIGKDTLNIEFKDSVYNTYTWNQLEYPEKDIRTWKLANDTLTMETWGGEFACKLTKISENEFKAVNLKPLDSMPEFSMIKRKRKWTKNLLFGEWHLNLSYAPELLKLVQPYYANEELEDYHYTISNSSIKNKFELLNSPIQINNTNEFIKFDQSRFAGGQIFWHVQSVNDSVMIVNMVFVNNRGINPTELKAVRLTKKN